MFSHQGDVTLFKKGAFCCATDLLHIEQEWLTSKKADLYKVESKVCALQDFLTEVDSLNISTLSKQFKREKDAFLVVLGVFSNFCTEIKLSSREYSAQDLKNHKMSAKTIAPLGMTYRGLRKKDIVFGKMNNDDTSAPPSHENDNRIVFLWEYYHQLRNSDGSENCSFHAQNNYMLCTYIYIYIYIYIHFVDVCMYRCF